MFERSYSRQQLLQTAAAAAARWQQHGSPITTRTGRTVAPACQQLHRASHADWPAQLDPSSVLFIFFTMLCKICFAMPTAFSVARHGY
jgi:nitrous oxide reductase